MTKAQLNSVRYPTTGHTYDEVTRPATKLQLLALRDNMLKYGNKDIAAAVDNVIDLMERYTEKLTAEFMADVEAQMKDLKDLHNTENDARF